MPNERICRVLFLFAFLLQTIAFSSVPAFGQVPERPIGAGPAAPIAEKFEKADGLITPLVNGGCMDPSRSTLRPPECVFITDRHWRENETVTLYDRSGGVWNQIKWKDQSHFRGWDLNIPGFDPIGQFLLVMRIKAESPTWYEIEINQRTGDVRYVRKNDAQWVKRDWRYYLERSGIIKFDPARTKLRKSPGGEIIEAAAKMNFAQATFLDMDGEWILLDAVDFGNPSDRYSGWIQYRKGNDLLVRLFSTGLGPPE